MSSVSRLGLAVKSIDQTAAELLSEWGVGLFLVSSSDVDARSGDLLRCCVFMITSDSPEHWMKQVHEIVEQGGKHCCLSTSWECLVTNSARLSEYLNVLGNILPLDGVLSLALPLTDDSACWELWKRIATSDIKVMLYINSPVEDSTVRSWSMEPIAGIVIDERSFVSVDEIHVLRPEIKSMITEIVRKSNSSIFVNASSGAPSYLGYLEWLLVRGEIKYEPVHLIDPLQPLRDDLDLNIYEVFEKDRTKYHMYKEAIAASLRDMKEKHIKVLIIGPGRGPLVDIVIDEVQQKGLSATLNAVEKNPKCIPLLEDKNKHKWHFKVNILHDDARKLKHHHYDLIISELLGSFGCNELAPEILMPFQHSKSTVFIPQSFENFIRPIFFPEFTKLDATSLERPYLAMPTSYDVMGEYEKVWKYNFPGNNESVRRKEISFSPPVFGKINAFEGCFVANLYQDISIGMLSSLEEGYCNSWYPYLLPVEEDNVAENSLVSFSIERCMADDLAVWYTWEYKKRKYNSNGQYSINLVPLEKVNN
ncbi:Piso0_005149 [Millerozyma farinosa CBS 7064]|uniref:Piso0_005149 protein n=1 Tax=Pichia sorbitophila (strain ATCC MYA-4447 / BCRC 22081 / CBS 7064 / NBRC 10061 / NRRL Y-12695) TaxID=559304 RepID=G8Y4C6_PICSO|nr:Piso0_005149 [Millerozyma farinosa CBS 7064]